MLRRYLRTTPETRYSAKLQQQIDTIIANSQAYQVHKHRRDYKCFRDVSTIDNYRNHYLLCDSALQSWYQHQFSNYTDLLSKMENGRIELRARLEQALLRESSDSLFMLEALEIEHAKGMF